MEEEKDFAEEPNENSFNEDDQQIDESKVFNETEKKKHKKSEKAAFTINFYSWSTPIIGLVMLIIGLAAGYFLRPVITGEQTSSNPAASSSTGNGVVEVSTPNPEAAAALESLYQQVRHFKGDENAAVTIIEFSDFQ